MYLPMDLAAYLAHQSSHTHTQTILLPFTIDTIIIVLYHSFIAQVLLKLCTKISYFVYELNKNQTYFLIYA